MRVAVSLQALGASALGAVVLVLSLSGDSPQQPIDQVAFKSNKRLLDSIDSWHEQIKKHQEKIRASGENDGGLRDHWRAEIENFRKQIDDAYAKLDKNKRERGPRRICGLTMIRRTKERKVKDELEA